MGSTNWTRRKLLRAAAVGAAAVSADPLARALDLSRRGEEAQRDRDTVLYVAGMGNAFHVFAQQRGEWHPMQRVASSEPSALLLSPGADRLFVANAIDRFAGLPTGSIETYCVDARSGRLGFVSAQALALAVKRPMQMAISPGGRTLAVANADGIISLHAMRNDGSTGEASAVRKDLRIAATGQAPRLHFLGEDHLCAACDGYGSAYFRLSFSGLTFIRHSPPQTQQAAKPTEALHASVLRHLDNPEPHAVLRHRLS